MPPEAAAPEATACHVVHPCAAGPLTGPERWATASADRCRATPHQMRNTTERTRAGMNAAIPKPERGVSTAGRVSRVAKPAPVATHPGSLA